MAHANAQFEINTDAIDSRGLFDSRYTCDQDNSSPELRWSNPPTETQGFALIAEDPDAPHGLFTHWVIYNIPENIHHLPAGVPPQETLPNGITQGVNSFGKLGYGGPCPPLGHGQHRYYFRIYALRTKLSLPPRLERQALLQEIEPHVISSVELMGRYQRLAQKAG
jgi:Raf kinase inhibitor-like YbhB/YbcL family protein